MARRIGAILEEAHYRHATIDARMSEQVFNRYLDMLASMFVALIVFGVSCKLLRVDELDELLGVFRSSSKHDSARQQS